MKDDFNAVRGILIGGAIGTVIWAIIAAIVFWYTRTPSVS